MIAKTKITKPDFIELMLLGILIIWTVTVLWLIAKSASTITMLTIESLIMFFIAFTSITAIVIAVILADIRKELKKIY
ncbi:MAG: hypothetical protein QW625_00380 [Candidatus Nanoarchaeia archaeon]